MKHLSPVSLKVNGDDYELSIPPWRTLLEVLRETLSLTGTKEGCNDGNCGACSVIVDGTLVNSCCMLGVEIDGCDVQTVEGLAQNGRLHPLQKTFLEETGMQCGFCTPGFLMSSKALLDANPDPSERQIRHWLSGNLCRCTGYDKIVRAVEKAAHMLEKGK